MVTVNSNVPNNTTVSNGASISSSTSDPNSGNNSSITNTMVSTSADLAVTKVGPATAPVGSNLTYTITVTNNGPSDAHDES